jgi:hypothetical protein
VWWETAFSLVRSMLRNGKIPQTYLQGVRGDGHKSRLHQFPLAQELAWPLAELVSSIGPVAARPHMVPPQLERFILGAAAIPLGKGSRRPRKVRIDKTHIEHNESGYATTNVKRHQEAAQRQQLLPTRSPELWAKVGDGVRR